MGATRNVFFALAPPASVRDALAGEAARLHAGWGGRATAANKLHMTLVFLDALPVPLDPAMLAAARAAAETIALPPFELVVDRADRFGRRIGWLGCSQVPAPLQDLHDALAEAISTHQVPMRREDAYAPHVTVLRDPRRVVPQAIAPIAWPVDGFVLMASAQTEYETLGHWPLR